MKQAYLYDGLRTPFGRYGGTLSSVRPDDLVAGLAQTLLARAGLDGSQIDDLILGCANQSGEDSRNVARHVVLAAGLPVSVAGQTVNRLCGSGLAAVIDAARAIKLNEGNLLLAGGVESMSRAPFVMAKATQAFGRDAQMFDSTIGSRFPNPAIVARFGDPTMAQTADNLAQDFAISRDQSDHFAATSQAKYNAALKADFFADEISAVTISAKSVHKNNEQVSQDEHPRPDSNLASLARLKALNTNGVVTAGNASGINDGAALLLLGDEQSALSLQRAPLARILLAAVVGVLPRVMGIGPALAIPKALERAGLALSQMDVIEINEAFAPQVLACLKQLNLAAHDERINPNGGAIALGHPLGASGARLVLTAARQLQRISGRYAVVSLCIGVGQGIALVIERV
ncbi:3-oxoadipyl-CoA thiolase [Sapientia aquatica]|uniref:3-oxoadipyl-CoA thiolase n=1 Tax=Sapientia aquatica TaxID=1549640 RepID=A0A4R5W4B5_9BURK|nr:3-oxoadipyl-CoA thiolase [Sapientia aquatica]TDK67442.1 3-oxoadipyl-CoA thiolase [Sapientia aquatica]